MQRTAKFWRIVVETPFRDGSALEVPPEFAVHTRARRGVRLTTSLVCSSPFIMFGKQEVNAFEQRCWKVLWPSAKPRQSPTVP